MPKRHLVLVITGCLALGAAVTHAAVSPEPGGGSAQGRTEPRPDAAPAPPVKRTPRTSDRCNTPAINCVLSDRQPAGSTCWCVTPFGPSYGRVP